ncbi:DUF4232 domain-containing protein [Streptomyces sp. SP18CS02]|uniref:DUF4232 domain-containing protein n=1 Tax=Streptomyces sp. SP18CS02 TaxID=3002531 RepID=UPI002E797808|nr:DUF4232 domain-containing protein [Streptomyces sp. SP18CS02]MEE1751888.1 DUF4232 domain-containing protein [Streptomyces sp. SP18CS02]
MRSFRTRTTAAAATALLAALSLTACQSGDDANAAGTTNPSVPAASSPAASASPAASGSSGSSDAPSSAASAAPGHGKPSAGTAGGSGDQGSGKGQSTGTGDTTASATCTGDNTKVVVSKVSRPINHLLLTVTNTGSGRCDAYYAPLLRFDDEQSVTRIIEDSKPQAVVTLAPGESAYASIVLNAERETGEAHGRIADKLTVHFAPRDGSGSTGAATTLTLPADTYKDDDASVTYWLSDMSDALTY